MSIRMAAYSANGTGPISSDDVSAFVAGWLATGYSGAFPQYTHGDLNLDGITDIADAYLLHNALISAQGTGFPFERLFAAPEPTTLALLIVGIFAMSVGRRVEAS
jgi:hypothetical protein